MRTWRLILAEARHRPLHSVLALLGIAVAVALPVFHFTTGASSKRETTRIMRDIGYNLRIIPRDTQLADYWRAGYSQHTLHESVAARFETQKGISYRHLIPMLTRRIDHADGSILVTGIAATEVAPRGHEKPSMIFKVERGTVFLGAELARTLGAKKGDSVELRGRSFRVASCLSETGSEDDVRAWLHLKDAQEVLDAKERINEIRAIDCHCTDPAVDNAAKLRAELARFLPEGRVIRLEAIAEARERQRRMNDRYFALVLPIVVILCALWIAFLALANVRQRASEIGILRALGHGSGRIAALFLGKAVLLGIGGAALGFAGGSLAAIVLGSDVFATKPGQIRVDVSMLGQALLLAPVFTAVATLVPTVIAVTQDPADILREAQ